MKRIVWLYSGRGEREHGIVSNIMLKGSGLMTLVDF